MCRQTELEIWPTVGLSRHRNFVGFQAPTWGQPLTVMPSNNPIWINFNDTHCKRKTNFNLKFPVPTGVHSINRNTKRISKYAVIICSFGWLLGVTGVQKLVYYRPNLPTIDNILICNVPLCNSPSGHLVSPLVCTGPWMYTVVLYCWCHSESASVLLYFTLICY